MQAVRTQAGLMLQVLASLRVEQQKPDDALQHLRESMQKWFPSLQRMMAESNSDRDEEEEEKAMQDEEHDLDAQLPSFEFRFETAKLLIELDETTEKAVQVSLASMAKSFSNHLLQQEPLATRLASSYLFQLQTAKFHCATLPPVICTAKTLITLLSQG